MFELLKDTPVAKAGTRSIPLSRLPYSEKKRWDYVVEPKSQAFPSEDGKNFDYYEIEFMHSKPEWFRYTEDLTPCCNALLGNYRKSTLVSLAECSKCGRTFSWVGRFSDRNL